MKKLFLIGLLLSVTGIGKGLAQTLSPWQEGYMDIHHINTGKGDATFCILPDGTTLLIDAGGNHRSSERTVAARPDESKKPGEWIAHYINRMMPACKSIDYYLMTHYHSDHVGGVREVYKALPCHKWIDRGDTYMTPDKDTTYATYLQLIGQLPATTIRQTFNVGTDQQITLLNHPQKYSGRFSVRNLYANGTIWDGKDSCYPLFPPTDGLPDREMPRENMYSCAIRLSYGGFDYYTGGDIPGYPRPGRPAWHDVETPLSKVTGQVEVAVLNHHGNEDGTNENFISALAPQNFILSTWDALHPNHTVLARLFSKEIYPESRNVYATNIHPATRIVIGDLINRMASTQGHIVVRVFPGGEQYRIYVLSDTDDPYKVLSESDVFSVWPPSHTLTVNTCLKQENKVLVVAHRADWRNAPENSLQAIQNCIDMGVDMVEIDLKRTKDGHLVLMHDRTIDRTMTGKGTPEEYTLAELKAMRLRNGAGHKTAHQIPTLEEAMLLCKGKILVNIDKGYDYFKEAYAILEKTGTTGQCIIKAGLPYEQVKAENGEVLDKMTFMPVVNLCKDGAEALIDGYLTHIKPVAYELVFDTDSKKVQRLLKKIRTSGAAIFINSLWPELCGGHDDDRAVEECQPDESWGWIISQGACLIQTDRPAQLINYLQEKRLHALPEHSQTVSQEDPYR